MTELSCEKFEWFGPSPIEPFNVGRRRPSRRGPRARRPASGSTSRARRPSPASTPRRPPNCAFDYKFTNYKLQITIYKFTLFLQNFGKNSLGFGCIGTDLCKKIRVFQHFSKSNSNLPDYPAENFEIWQYFANFATFSKILLNFHENC